MDFKQIRTLAINLYKQGENEKNIQKLCQVPISKELISSWIQEDEELERVKTLTKLIKKLKKIKTITINSENKDDIIAQLQEVSFKILEMEKDNEIAINELIRCYTMQKQFDIARTYGDRVLQVNPNNKFILYNMAKLEMEAQDLEKAELYNNRLLEIEKDNKQGNIQKRIIQERKTKIEESEREAIEEKIRQLNLQEQLENEKINKDKKTIEEEQDEFAREQMKKERYNDQSQEEYMQTVSQMFYNGRINESNLEIIRDELYKYPNKIQSAMFLSELYSLITQSEERGIEEIENFIDNINSLSSKEYAILDERIRQFRQRISYKKEYAKNIQEKESKDKGPVKKQDLSDIIR